MPGPPVWTVPLLWAGATVVVAGGGPSFDDGQVQLLRAASSRQAGRVRILAVNNAAFRLRADLVYFADHSWFTWNRKPLAAVLDAGTPVVTINPDAARAEPRLKFLVRGEATGLSTAPTQLALGSNGGHQAVNLAYLLGAARILLVGFDMRAHAATDGQGRPRLRTHWHDGHPVPTDPRVYAREMLPKWPAIAQALAARDVRVVNCSPGSALTVFPMGDLADELAPASGLSPTTARSAAERRIA